ncbi:MAG: PaaI family thioesterase [Dehalococcoidia bacterium]|nr:PaaI family thioesterase [Dehalococcoidia bacterium]
MDFEAFPALARMQAPRVYADNGMRFVAAGEGWADLEFVPTERVHNLYGFVHGGVWLMVADSAMGGALGTVAPLEKQLITTQLDFRWLRKFTGAKAMAHGRVLHHGRSISHCEVAITGDDGKPIARGTGTYVVI